jgi:hypothetical protein
MQCCTAVLAGLDVCLHGAFNNMCIYPPPPRLNNTRPDLPQMLGALCINSANGQAHT